MLVDPAIQLVDVDGMQAALQPVVFRLQAGDRGLVLLLLVSNASSK